MENDYGQAYKRLYREHWWWRSREEFLIRVIQGLCLPANPNILDLGCGDGLFFDRLAEFGGTIEGLESDPSLVSRETAERYRIHIGPLDRTFGPIKRYTLILMLDVLEHLQNPEESLKQAVELLEPGGRLVLTVPAFRCLWTNHDDMNHHYTRYTKRSLATVAKIANLRIDRCQYFFHWLVPLKLVVRLKERLIQSQPKPPNIPSPIVNRTMLALSLLEQRLFGNFSLPIGTSLLAVGKRSSSQSSP